MRRIPIAVGLAAALILGLALAASRANRVPNVKDSTGAVTLPNGWKITPAGRHVKLPGDLPMTRGSQPWIGIHYLGFANATLDPKAKTDEVRRCAKQTVQWAVNRPAHVNINTLEIMSIDQAWAPFAIHREK